MDTARHRGTPRKAPVLALAGLTVVGLAAAGTLFTVSPAHAAGPAAQQAAQPVAPVDSTFPDAPGRGTVTVLDRSTHAVLSRTRLGVEPTSLAVDPMGRQALLTNYGGASVSYVPLGR